MKQIPLLLLCALSLSASAQEAAPQFYKLRCPCAAEMIAAVGDVVVREPRDSPAYVLIRSTREKAAASTLANRLESPQPQDWVTRQIIITTSGKEQSLQIMMMHLDLANPRSRSGSYTAFANDEQLDLLTEAEIAWHFIAQP